MKLINYNSPTILTFSFTCVVGLILDKITGGVLNELLFSSPAEFHFTNPVDYLRLFTHICGHTNLQHLNGNLTIILVLGALLEEKYGSDTLILMILLTAFVTGLSNALFFDVSVLGASGIVFMLVILGSFTNTKHKGLPLTFILVALIYLSNEVLAAFREDNISQFAHIMGGICGGVFGLNFRKSSKER